MPAILALMSLRQKDGGHPGLYSEFEATLGDIRLFQSATKLKANTREDVKIAGLFLQSPSVKTQVELKTTGLPIRLFSGGGGTMKPF